MMVNKLVDRAREFTLKQRAEELQKALKRFFTKDREEELKTIKEELNE